ncbi:hypothetical protein Poli38472_000047 [Pythium oligandrum]|uniref:RRM domain-containing protein n=1 Tax=Pythium oligandrum TaxID=41045 RepID=A0A8K1CBZ0_PYTOL|nr:hypothetical protein Poli38472_000047 [Pythium oligandrum]|eukprot:TMW60005.1 hypothetical protein Poli38472_000047 [Pythium oligandrum]
MSSILASLDMSLDDIIAKKKTNPDARPAKNYRPQQTGSAGPVRGNRRNHRRNEPYSRRGDGDDDLMDIEDDQPAASKKGPAAKRKAVVVKNKQQDKGGKKGSILSRLGKASNPANEGTKILVKNLQFDILEDEVRELFETVGKVTKAEIVYDRSGRSKGVARVWFAKRSDAEKAIKQYDGRTLDQQPMQITLDGDKNVRNGLFGTALSKREDDGVKFKVNLGGKKDQRDQKGRGRGRGGRGGGRGGGAPKTAEDLNDEMDTYMKDA